MTAFFTRFGVGRGTARYCSLCFLVSRDFFHKNELVSSLLQKKENKKIEPRALDQLGWRLRGPTGPAARAHQRHATTRALRPPVGPLSAFEGRQKRGGNDARKRRTTTTKPTPSLSHQALCFSKMKSELANEKQNVERRKKQEGSHRAMEKSAPSAANANAAVRRGALRRRSESYLRKLSDGYSLAVVEQKAKKKQTQVVRKLSVSRRNCKIPQAELAASNGKSERRRKRSQRRMTRE